MLIRFELLFVACKGVEIGQMIFLVKQLLRVVLSVDVDESAAELFERCHADRATVHAADVSAVCINLALHLQLLRVKLHLIF